MRILATTDASAVMPRISGFPWDRKSFHACRLPSQNLEHEINILKIRNEQLYAKRDMYTRSIPIRFPLLFRSASFQISAEIGSCKLCESLADDFLLGFLPTDKTKKQKWRFGVSFNRPGSRRHTSARTESRQRHARHFEIGSPGSRE